MATLFAAIISVPTFRFSGVYFAIGTLILAEALRIWMINWEFTGGAQGLSFPIARSPSLTAFYYIMLGIATGMSALLVYILRSQLGLGLRAIRDNQQSAQNMGVNIFRTKLYAFLISAFAAGLIGGVHAVRLSVIEPYSIYSVTWTISMINIVIIGGMGTIIGPIVGAIFVTFLAEALANFYTIHLMITGLIFILVIRFMPAGIWGWLSSSKRVKRLIKGYLVKQQPQQSVEGT
jgi:branched-chain amino acid transport system permease protein